MYFWQNGVHESEQKNFLEILKPAYRADAGEAKQQHISGIMKIIYSLRYVADSSEQEVLQELGDPHLIAKTRSIQMMEVHREDYGEYSCRVIYGNEQSFLISRRKDGKK